MAKETPETAPAEPTNGTTGADEWETIRTGLGTEWDFDRDGALIGNYLGVVPVDIDREGEMVTTHAYQFAPEDNPDDIVFVWESAEITAAFRDPTVTPLGARMRIVFLGRDQFTGDKGPQQIKRYRVQVAK